MFVEPTAIIFELVIHHTICPNNCNMVSWDVLYPVFHLGFHVDFWRIPDERHAFFFCPSFIQKTMRVTDIICYIEKLLPNKTWHNLNESTHVENHQLTVIFCMHIPVSFAGWNIVICKFLPTFYATSTNPCSYHISSVTCFRKVLNFPPSFEATQHFKTGLEG